MVIQGIYHLIMAGVFFLGIFAIDLDHTPFSFSEAWNVMWNKCGVDTECTMRRGFMHNPIIFYALSAFTVGLGLHLFMDGII